MEKFDVKLKKEAIYLNKPVKKIKMDNHLNSDAISEILTLLPMFLKIIYMPWPLIKNCCFNLIDNRLDE